MATTMVKDTTNSKWKLTETASTTQTYQKTIKCGGSYMEYDVDVTVTTKGGTATTPATTIVANPVVSVAADGTITATTAKEQNVTPTIAAGYISSGTAGKITVEGETNQSLPVKGATTYTPGTTDQTIAVDGNASGFFITGTQKILGDANLVPGNIKSGVSIFGVLGTLTSIAVDDPEVDNAAAPQILSGYEAFDKNGGTLVGSMANFSGVDLTSSNTSGKTMTLTLNGAGTLYTIKMYAGSTGYAVKDSTYITDTVAASKLKNGNTVINSGSNVNASGSSDQTITITSGYYPSDRTVVFKKMAAGSATTPATTINVTPELSTTYTTNKGYKIAVSGTKSVTPTVTAGYVSSGTAGTITVADDGDTYVAQSTLSTSSVTPSTASSQTVTIGAGYYPTSRTVTVGQVTVGSIVLGASVTSNSIVATNSNASSVTIGSTAQPSGTNYIKLTPTAAAKATASTFNAGYISSKPSDATVSNQAGTAIYLTVYDGTIE